MVRSALIERSPLRILEKSTHGGLGKGNLGAIAARKGVGKTACLVHIATDQLIQNKNVIHVSFASRTDHIIDWYEDIFREIARQFDLEAAMNVYEEIIRNRIILNFNQAGVHLNSVIRSTRSMIREANFSAHCIVVDGYDFERISKEELAQVKQFAGQNDLEIWFSVTHRDDQPPYKDQGIPSVIEEYIEGIDVLICLRPADKHVLLELKKDHASKTVVDMHLKLDPKSLLIAREV